LTWDVATAHRQALGDIPGASHFSHRDEIADDRGNHGTLVASLFQQPSEFQT